MQLLILASVNETPTLNLSLFVARVLHRLLLTVMFTGGGMNTCTTTERQKDVWQHPALVLVTAY